ncbi:MAG: phytoene desaturase family protein [Candidatus Helarchaeota archaeon]
MSEKYDALIVGGGVGGTAIGALLAYNGYKVKLFEKNKIIGGRCTTYDYKGFKLDLGVHLFGVGPNGYLGDVLRRINMPDAIKWVLSKDPRPLMYYCGEKLIYSRKAMSQIAEKYAPGEFEKAMQFFADCLSIRKKKIRELYYTPFTEFLNQYTTNKIIHTLLAGIVGQYFCVLPNKASAGEFAMCFRQVAKSRSSAYPVGGCIAIPEAYADGIKKNGGEVQLNAKVKRIIVEDDKATGIELEDGTVYNSDIIISNADIQNTVLNLVGEKKFPSEYVKRIKNLEYAQYCLSIKVALDQKITDQKLILSMPYDYGEMSEQLEGIFSGKVPDKIGGMITSPTNYDPNLAPPGKQSIFFGTGCLPGESAEKYKQIGEKCLESLKEVLPEVEDHILWYKTDPPTLVESYAGEYGNIIGVAQTVDQIHERRPSQISPIKGLYIVGAEAGGHGIGAELAANSAIELANILLEKTIPAK